MKVQFEPLLNKIYFAVGLILSYSIYKLKKKKQKKGEEEEEDSLGQNMGGNSFLKGANLIGWIQF